MDNCWNCESSAIETAGVDDNGVEITICSECDERQEEE